MTSKCIRVDDALGDRQFIECIEEWLHDNETFLAGTALAGLPVRGFGCHCLHSSRISKARHDLELHCGGYSRRERKAIRIRYKVQRLSGTGGIPSRYVYEGIRWSIKASNCAGHSSRQSQQDG